jgi:hypothetical protein
MTPKPTRKPPQAQLAASTSTVLAKVPGQHISHQRKPNVLSHHVAGIAVMVVVVIALRGVVVTVVVPRGVTVAVVALRSVGVAGVAHCVVQRASHRVWCCGHRTTTCSVVGVATRVVSRSRSLRRVVLWSWWLSSRRVVSR